MFFFSSRRRHTRCALVTGVQTCALPISPNRTARSAEQALALAGEIGYPLVVRPSYVLGGRAMEVVHADADLAKYMRDAVQVSNDSPVLLDCFLDNAVEVDIDVIADRTGAVLIGGVMEHIEEDRKSTRLNS